MSVSKFSIITPLYNKGAYFSETADSVLGQEFGDWEWIIVDDGSTDEGVGIASDLAASDDRIHCIRQQNQGPCTARNAGIAKASGEWLIFLDADDLLVPDCLQLWSQSITETDAPIQVGGWHEVDPENCEIIETHLPPGIESSPGQGMDLIRNLSIAHTPWPVTAAIVKREILKEPFLWDEAMNRLLTEDTVFWWKLVLGHEVITRRHAVFRYRRGTEECRDQFEDVGKWSKGLFHALEANLAFLAESGAKANKQQIANLARVLGSFGARAEGEDEHDVAAAAYRLSDRLLRSHLQLSLPILMRALPGTRLFEKLRRSN